MNPLISVISPVYAAEFIIEELVSQMKSALGSITENYEIVLIEDCGPDNSWEKIQQLCNNDARIKAARLSRNFGQHFAITAGIEKATGDYLIVMDCDLQDNPKYIRTLYEKALEGYDIVFTQKEGRKHSIFKNITASLFNIVFNYLVDNRAYHSKGNVGAYSLLTRKAANAFMSYNDYRRHYLMVLRWIGFKHCYVQIEHQERYSGKSSYSFRKLINHALDGIVFHSDKLLRIFVNIGLVISLFSFIAIGIIITLYFFRGFLSGWASLMSVLLFSTGIILTGIGVLGIYLGKTFEQAKNRPKYIVDKQINF